MLVDCFIAVRWLLVCVKFVVCRLLNGVCWLSFVCVSLFVIRCLWCGVCHLCLHVSVMWRALFVVRGLSFIVLFFGCVAFVVGCMLLVVCCSLFVVRWSLVVVCCLL